MNHNKPWIITMALSLFIITMLASCATVPETQETVVEETEVQESAVTDIEVTETNVTNADETLVQEALTNLTLAKEDAMEARAPRAATEDFNDGEKKYSDGLYAYSNGELNETVQLYRLATEAFKKSIITANKQKEIALAAIAEAEAAIKRAELNADSAIAEGME